MKQLPCDEELERNVLGMIIFEPKALSIIGDLLTENTFYGVKNKIVWNSIRSLSEMNEAIDSSSVFTELKKMKQLNAVGGIVFISSLCDNIYSSGNIEMHAMSLKQLEMRRELILACREITEKCLDDSYDSLDLIELAIEKSYQVSKIADINRGKSPDHYVDEVIKKSQIASEKNGIPGLQIGFSDLDTYFGGFQKTDLIIIAGRPAMGKSALALCMARNTCYLYGNKGLFFSLEMSGIQLTARSLSIESRINARNIMNGNLSDQQRIDLNDAAKRLSVNHNLRIDDTGGLTITELSIKAKRAKIEHGIDFVVVDYLQLITDTSLSKSGTRADEIASISRKLKNLAKSLDIPVIALAQLNREVEKRHDRKPILSDLKESGGIEEAADAVILLYRPEYYGFTEDESGNSTKGIATAIVAKNRHGSTGECPIGFNAWLTEFSDTEAKSQNIVPDVDGWITPKPPDRIDYPF